MDDADIAALAHADLTFNAPLSDARADELVSSLRPLAEARVVDLGCGWAELLLRTLEAEPTAAGTGVDTSPAAIQRGRSNAAARGLSSRVRLDAADVRAWPEGTGDPADVVVCMGASHAWGGAPGALAALRRLLPPGGRLLFGDGYWRQAPDSRALAALDAGPDEFGTVAELTDLALDSGYRLLSLSRANTDEWDAFESRWCAGLERWLLDNPSSPEAEQVRSTVDRHRNSWLHGYRDVLGFAYLTLVAA